MFKYQRGDVYLVREHSTQGHEIRKTRPWILVGSTSINIARSTLIAIPLSTQIKEIPNLSIKIYLNNNHACAILDQIRAIDKKRLLHFEGNVSLHEMSLIEDGLRVVLAL